LLNWKDWNEKDFVVALGSVWRGRDGNRCVPYLRRDGSGRRLILYWIEYDWYEIYRFAAVRKLASDLSTSDSQPSVLESFEPLKLEIKYKNKEYKLVEKV
jgi:hypothetical protein